MKNIGDNDGSPQNLPATPPADAGSTALAQFRRAHSNRLEVAEDSDLVELLHVYAENSLAHVNALIATSTVVVQDVAFFRGLKSSRPDDIYEFASFTETNARHREPGAEESVAEEDADSSEEATATDDGSTEHEDTRENAPVEDAGNAFSDMPGGTCAGAEAAAWAEALAQVEAETGVGFGKSRGRKKNRAAGRLFRRVRKLAQELLDNPAPLPDFPGYDPQLTFFTWLRSNIEPTEAGVYSSLLGATTSNALKHMTSSMTLVHGLPKFLARCLDGDFTIEHVDCVTRLCRDLHFEHLPTIDEFLDKRRADITIETFKRSLSLKIAATQPPEDTLKSVALRRRVDLSTGDDGTAYLTLTGPAPELQACYRRLDAFARAVYKSNTSAFSNQLKTGDCFDEDRSISALMFDILTRTRPQMKLRIISTNDADGTSTSSDFPLDGLFAGPDGVPMHEGESLLDYIERVFDDLDENGYGEAAQESSASTERPASSEESAQRDKTVSQEKCAPREESASQDKTAPVDRTFESQILEAILSSHTTTTDAAENSAGVSPNASGVTDINDVLSSLIGSRASGARPTAEGSAAATAGAVDAFGNPIRVEGGCRISFEFLLDMPTNEYWLSNQASTFITAPMLTLLSQFLQQVGNEDDGQSAEAPGSAGTAHATTPEPSTTAPASATKPIPGTARAGNETATAAPASAAPAPTAEPTPAAGPLSSAEVCDLAGMLPDGSPIPADMARRVAGYSATWTRLLTDPATGTPVDAKAETYAIPNSVRRTLVAQYVTCTFPGCTMPAETSEVDHIDPFNHADPSQGGLTRFGNLHSLCKLHHSLKTARKFDVRMTEPGHLEYVFRRGATVEVVTPDNPLNVEHARLFLECFASALPRANRPLPVWQSGCEPVERSQSMTVQTLPPRDLTPAQKQDHVLAYLACRQGTKRQYLDAHGISQKQMYKWKAAVADGDLDANLIPRQTGKMTSREVAEIRKLRDEVARLEAEKAKSDAEIERMGRVTDALGKAIDAMHAHGVKSDEDEQH
jgi:transposase-like protein